MDFKCKILSSREFQRNEKKYFIVKIYLSFCDNIITCFVNKDVFDKIQDGLINDINLAEHLYIYINSAKEIYFAIKE